VPEERVSLPKEYVLFVGSLEPRKNLPCLFAAWSIMQRKIPETQLLGAWAGVGGIGSAQTYYQSPLYNGADNTSVYLHLTFGILAVLAMLSFAASTRWLQLRRRPFDGWVYGVVLAGLA